MIKNSLTVSDTVNRFQSKYSTPYCMSLGFNGCNILLTSNSFELINKLTIYYRDFVNEDLSEFAINVVAIEADAPAFDLDFTVKVPDPGKTKIKEEFVDLSDGRIVRKRLTGVQFTFGSGKHLAIGPVTENYNQIVNFVNNRYIEWFVKRGYLLVHAAGIKFKDKGIILSGFSGMGKSTLALNFMSRGSQFISNDRILFKKDGLALKMLGVPKLPRVNPGTILNNPDLDPVITEDEKIQFSDIPKDNLWELENKYDVDIDQCFGKDKFLLHSNTDLIICLNWDRRKSFPEINKVDLRDRRDLLRNLMKSLGLFFEFNNGSINKNPTEEEYLECINATTVVEIKGGVDFDIAAEACIKFLANKG